MPSIDAPAYYDRAKTIAAGQADHFLRTIDPDYYEADTGSVESPLGHVALVKIDRDMIRSYVSEWGDPWMSEARNFEPGWYIIRTDDHGLIWGMAYGGWCYQHDAFCSDTHAEESARADFAEAESVDQVWNMDRAAEEEGDSYNT